MISVVITAYNGEKYIEKQLASIQEQTLKADEVIILDDVSSDSTVDIVERYIYQHNLSNWRCYTNTKNLGYKQNFKNGIKKAQGDFVFLCDQDDVWKKNKIETMVGIMQENPQILALNCATSIIDADDSEVPVKLKKNYQNSNFLYHRGKLERLQYFNYEYVMKHNLTPGCAMCIRKGLSEQFLSTYKCHMPHDWHLNLLASIHSGCCFLNEKLVEYRVHDTNAIGANTGLKKALISRTRRRRIEDYSLQLQTLEELENSYRVNASKDILKMHMYLSHRISFYKKPNPMKYIKILTYKEYCEIVKLKTRVWEILVAFRLDGLITRIMKG